MFHVVAVFEPILRWWLPRRATVGAPSGSPASPDAPGVRTPSRYAPRTSPSGRCVRSISSAVLCHRIRTGTPAQGRVDHLHHHTPVTLSKSPHNPGTQHSDHRTLCRAPDHTHAEQQQPDGNTLQVDKQITPITPIKRHRAAAGRVRYRPGPLKTAGVEVRSSARTSTSTRNPRPTPTHPHATLKSRYLRWCEWVRLSVSGVLSGLVFLLRCRCC